MTEAPWIEALSLMQCVTSCFAHMQESKAPPSFAAIVKDQEAAPSDHKAPSVQDAALDVEKIEPSPAPGADTGSGYPTLQEAAEVTGPTGSEAEAKTSFTPSDDAATPSAASDATDTTATSDKAAADAEAGSAVAGAAGSKDTHPAVTSSSKGTKTDAAASTTDISMQPRPAVSDTEVTTGAGSTIAAEGTEKATASDKQQEQKPGQTQSDTGASDEVTKAAGAKAVDPGTGEPAAGDMAKELEKKMPLGATVAHVEGSTGQRGLDIVF
jgi:hypothetical protein